jgi:outer membrane protein OmpA-like peptidoglycan-associated protein
MTTIVTILIALMPWVHNPVDDALALQEANKNFEREQYNLAIEYYLKIQKKDGDVHYFLAESYRRIFNYAEAERYYLEAINSGSTKPLASYYYALTLKSNSKYTESITHFDTFVQAHGHVPELEHFVEQAIIDRAGSQAAVRELATSDVLYSLNSESFNSEYNDYAPACFDTTKIMITSSRLHSAHEVIDERYGEAFTDNYFFERGGNGWNDISRKTIRGINSRYNDGSGSFNLAKTKYYFTVCGTESSECQIFLSEYKQGRWSDPVALNNSINLKKFESKHPTVSPGGDTLLFASNRPGGHGQFDIWMSITSGDEAWGPAFNLGENVNTRFNDLAPSFSEFSHIFFFSSEGHQGFGGMDLYMSKRFSNGTTAIYNVGLPFNSNRDDCFLSLGARTMFISSNRDGGKGKFDIYSAPVGSPLSFVSRIALRHRAGRGDIPLLMAGRESTWMDIYASRNEDRIGYEHLSNEKKKIVDRMISNKNAGRTIDRNDFSQLSAGEYEQLLGIAQVQQSEIELRRKFHGTVLATINPPQNTRAFGIHSVIADSLSGQPVAGINVLLMNAKGEVLKATTTNESGEFRFTNVESNEQLYLTVERGTDRKTKLVAKNLVILKEIAASFAFDNVYFDTDQHVLRDDAKKTLKRLAEFLLRFPDLQVEIFAYADDRGRDEYNFTLSEKRGHSVRSYLGELGVNQTSIAVVAKGRQFDATVSNLEEHRQYNRRVEFYVNGATKESVAANGYKGAP